nr:RHS repeat-associated core domain-containing protein [Treponema pedis]
MRELDEETGLYYYGARYLDPKYSRWLSGDPALNDYIPKAPIDDEAKKHSWNGGKKLILIMKKDFVGMMIVVKIIGKGVIIYMSEVKTIFL